MEENSADERSLDGHGPVRRTADTHATEVARGERFAFGDNWASFLSVLDEERIGAAERGIAAHAPG
jgi:hypothetical protein